MWVVVNNNGGVVLFSDKKVFDQMIFFPIDDDPSDYVYINGVWHKK